MRLRTKLRLWWHRLWAGASLRWRRLRTRARLWWHRLFIRRDEFHHSLNLDYRALMDVTPDERERYHEDLGRRRASAHERDLDREDAAPTE